MELIEKYFHFPKTEMIDNATFDGSLESFFGKGIEGAIRENIQNSLDARLRDDSKVKIQITIDENDKSELPGIDEIIEHIRVLEGGNEYTNNTIKELNSSVKNNKVKVLTMEDKNTKGLSGAKNVLSNDSSNTFRSYAYKKGHHNKLESTSEESVRGGSHGIGKISNNAMSDIHLMYFSNCDEYGDMHVGGSIHLIEHILDGQPYKSTGYFTNKNEDNNLIPFENKNFSNIFEKEDRGLKIIIPFLREEFSDFQDIVRAICDNFFISILNDKIEITVCDHTKNKEIVINSETLSEIVENPLFYPLEIMKKVFTPFYVKTFLKHEPPISLEIKSLEEDYNFNLYFTYNEEIPAGRMAIVRSMGMKIVDFKIRNNYRKPFNAVLIGGPKEDEFLKSMENESHTQISADFIKNEKAKKNAKKFIRNLEKEIKTLIDDQIVESVEASGKLDTSEIISELEVSFKSDLEKTVEKVRVNNKTLVKKKEKREKAGGNGKSVPKNTDRKRIPRKIKPSQSEGDDIEAFILPHSSVNRISLDRKEIIEFDFTNIDSSKNWEICNIGFVVVDGMGKEYKNEANLDENYKGIYDLQSKKEYKFDDFCVADVRVYNQKCSIEMIKRSTRLDSLKYLFRIEVEK